MKSREVKVAGLTIGGGTPIKIQTMCNTHTQDVIPSVEQCVEMAAAGAELIRLTTQGMKEVEALKEIKDILRERGIETPLVADVHFSSDVAIEVAKVGSINKASENLGMAQPNISRALKDLEADVGINIFDRSSKGMNLTPEGKEFIAYAQQIIYHLFLLKH